MDITCPYCGQSHPIDAPRQVGRAVESCPLCRARYELFYVGGGKPPVAMRLRDLSSAPAAKPSVSAAATRTPARSPQPDARPDAPAEPESPSRPARPAHRRPHARPSDESTPPSPLQPGDIVGGYRIRSLLGRGGMGFVFRAEQLSLRRDVALKVLAPHLAQHPHIVLRFMREAYAAAQLSHHHLVQIYDVGAAGPLRFFSMEYIQGVSLAELVQSRGALPDKQAATYALQAARGLKFAHQHGLVHRDVKPANLLLSQDGLVKVVDLGVVLAVDSRIKKRAFAGVDPDDDAAEAQFLGTPGYAAPEQQDRADQAAQRSDVYSLGCTLYALLTGRPPFAGRTEADVAAAHRSKIPGPPSDDPALSRLVLTMMAKRPDDRYQTMGEVVDALEAYLGQGAAAVATPDEVAEVRRATDALRQGRHWPLARAAVLVAIGTTCVTTAALLAMALRKTAAGGAPAHLAVWGYGFAITSLSLLLYSAAHAWRSEKPIPAAIRNFFVTPGQTDLLSYRVMAPAVLAIAICYLCGWLGPVLAVLAVSGLVAFLLRKAADAAVEQARQPAIEHTQLALKAMRERGVDEAMIRAALVRHAGPLWRPLTEASLGYAAALAMGQVAAQHAAGGRRADDWLSLWVARQVQHRLDRRQIKLLAAQEARLRIHLGAEPDNAIAEADRSAKRLSEAAHKVRASARQHAQDVLEERFEFVVDDSGRPAVKPRRIEEEHAKFADGDLWDALDDDALDEALRSPTGGAEHKKKRADDAEEEDVEEESTGKKKRKRKKHDPDEDEGLEGYVRQSYFERRFGTPLDVVLGPTVRIVIAAVLLAGFAAWCRVNKGGAIAAAIYGDTSGGEVTPLRLSWLPTHVTDRLGSWGAAAAGMILVLSLMGKGRRYAALVFVAAAAAVFASPLLESAAHLPPYAGGILTGLLCFVALLNREMQE